ncbi:hypothetical protein [Flavobacterium lacus]|uniref:hypothetical protein n=1 Tax=Flavobacterium lacus TaxID=1353778 RepID=UPI001C65F288|nr:hypothetical protein [Flavobacterium lacus]
MTTKLQSELDKINSPVKLLTIKDTTIRMNFDSWAFAEIDNRNIDVCCFEDSEQMHLQLVDREIIAGQITIDNLAEIAFIIDGWLSKNKTVRQLKDGNNEFRISEKYSNLLTLTIDEVLEKRWTNEYKSIIKEQTLFNAELFLELKNKLSYLFPFFSHDNLWFSNILELPNDNFKSPIIYCNKDTFEIGITLDNLQKNNSFKTKNIDEAVHKTLELLPIDFEKTINPLKN